MAQGLRMVFRRLLAALRRATSPYRTEAYWLLREDAARESADYAALHLHQAMLFPDRVALWDYAIGRISGPDGLVLEFGVHEGASISHLAAALPQRRLYGFDSFEGLAEDWTGYHLRRGAFDLKGKMPAVPANVTLVKGWFADTLPHFLADHGGIVDLLHIDCDTRESAAFVLNALGPRLAVGSVIVFDEYFGYPGWQQGEFAAWQQLCKTAGIGYEYIAFSNMQAAVRITRIGVEASAAAS